MSAQMAVIHVLTMPYVLMKLTVICVSVMTVTRVMEKCVPMLTNVQLIQKPVPKMPSVLTKKAVTHVPVVKVMSVMVWSEAKKRDVKTSTNARSAVEINATQVPTAVILMAHMNVNVQKDTLVMDSIAKISTNVTDQTNVIPMHSVSIPPLRKTLPDTLVNVKMVSLTHMVTDVSAMI